MELDPDSSKNLIFTFRNRNIAEKVTHTHTHTHTLTSLLHDFIWYMHSVQYVSSSLMIILLLNGSFGYLIKMVLFIIYTTYCEMMLSFS